MDGNDITYAHGLPSRFAAGVLKDESSAKRFDRAPRFTLKTAHNYQDSNYLHSNDHKPTSYFQVRAVALAPCFFFTASFGSLCRYRRSHSVLAATRRRPAWPCRLFSIE